MNITTDTVPCKYSWCEVTHGADDAVFDERYGEYHSVAGIARIEAGVLRTDHALDSDGPYLNITDSLEWEIRAEDAPEFFAKLRGSIDEAEELFARFVEANGRPLERRTIPGQPELDGRGGGL